MQPRIKYLGFYFIVAVVLIFMGMFALASVLGHSECPSGQVPTSVVLYNAALKIPTTVTVCIVK